MTPRHARRHPRRPIPWGPRLEDGLRRLARGCLAPDGAGATPADPAPEGGQEAAGEGTAEVSDSRPDRVDVRQQDGP